jgi:hypothetical protein
MSHKKDMKRPDLSTYPSMFSVSLPFTNGVKVVPYAEPKDKAENDISCSYDSRSNRAQLTVQSSNHGQYIASYCSKIMPIIGPIALFLSNHGY